MLIISVKLKSLHKQPTLENYSLNAFHFALFKRLQNEQDTFYPCTSRLYLQDYN